MVRYRIQSVHITAILHHREMFPNAQQQQHHHQQQAQPLAPEPPIDWRQQTLANALILFPQIVAAHCAKYPALPPRANDIFELSISTATPRPDRANPAEDDGIISRSFKKHGIDYGGDNRPHFSATLSHSHADLPAVRVVLISSGAELSIGAALKALFFTSTRCIGEAYEELCPRPEAMTAPLPGPVGLGEYDGIALREAVDCAVELRASADEFDRERRAASEGSPVSGGEDDWAAK